ncbi:NAD(P)/FAD-dependent oxidoreductase [Chitinimonas sp.]|uniref:NAD(P)/FAD-dependent oxidoreductase n=1 Tax=Chitinimonas sp. TaxID=1934313 RepID=UPI0035AF26DB
MPHLYDAAMYRFDQPAPSYWRSLSAAPGFAPLAGGQSVDVAIIGGGFTGLSAALHLARDHAIEPLLLDAGDIGWGASSRNAGFNTLAATKLGLADMQQRWGEAATADFFASQLEGIELAEALAAEEGFDLALCGPGSFIVAHCERAYRDLQAETHLWRQAAGLPVRMLSREEFAAIGHGGREQFGAMQIEAGGGINPLAYTMGLASAATRHGARLHGHSAVLCWERRDGLHLLHTASGTVRARRVIVATNGYPLPHAPAPLRHRLLPVISNIVVTAPLSDAQWAAEHYRTLAPACDARHLLHYYRRLPDGRLLFGARGDLSGSEADGVRMQAALQAAITRKFPAWEGVAIDYFWRGMVSVTRKLAPSFGVLPDDPTVFYGFGCYGNGVNTMPWIGRSLARQLAGVELSRTERCPVYAGLPARLPPLRCLQKLGLRAAYVRYARLDARTS